METALGCERVLSSLPMVRWAQPVFDSAAQLLESATSFIAANMSGVLASDRYREREGGDDKEGRMGKDSEEHKSVK